jgi:hypothetical protein
MDRGKVDRFLIRDIRDEAGKGRGMVVLEEPTHLG